MRVSPFQNFRKGWGRISDDLSEGNYVVEIDNKWDSSIFDGKKYFIISEISDFGGKNEFLAITFIVVGSISLLLGVLFIIFARIKPKGLIQEQDVLYNYE